VGILIYGLEGCEKCQEVVAFIEAMGMKCEYKSTYGLANEHIPALMTADRTMRGDSGVPVALISEDDLLLLFEMAFTSPLLEKWENECEDGSCSINKWKGDLLDDDE